MTIRSNAEALVSRLSGAGFLPREIAFRKAIELFLDNGGTAARASELLADAVRERAGDAADTPHQRSEAGQKFPVHGQTSGARLAAPSRKARGIAAIASVQSTMARSLFDSTILPDGRSIREVRWSECPGLASRWRRASRLLIAIYNHSTPSDPGATLDTVVSEEGLREIIDSVERFNDIH